MISYRKWIAVLLAICCCMPLLSGCWSRKELNDLAIQLATAVDKVGNQYRVATQVVIPGEVSTKTISSGMSPVTLFQATAPTMMEAFRELTETSSRKIYSAHIRILVIGEALAKEGIAEALDLFSRNPESRTDFYLMIARNSSAMKVLEILTSLERIPAENLFYSLDTSAKNWSPTTTVTIEELINQLVTEGTNPVLTGVEIVGNKAKGKQIKNVQEINPSAQTKLKGLAVFRGDKLAGWLNEEQSIGYNYIKNNIKGSAAHLECPDGGKVGIETLRNKTVVKAKVVNDKPLITIKIDNISSVSETECKIDLDNPKTIKWLEASAAQRIQNTMEETIRHTQQKYKFDVLGFGSTLYQYKPNVWEALRADWNDLYWPNLPVQYEVVVHIRKIGTTKNSFLDQIKL